MITAIAAIFGALTGLVPSVLQFFSKKEDNAHAIKLRQLDIEAAKLGAAAQVDLANAQSDIRQQEHIYNFANAPSGVRWIDALAILVRPYITLVIFHLWFLIELALFVAAVNGGLRLDEIVPIIWDDTNKGMLASIIGFWFGNRMGLRGSQMAATLAVSTPHTTITPPQPPQPPQPPLGPGRGFVTRERPETSGL